MKHKLSVDDADKLNVGKALDPGQSADDKDSGYLSEGDSVEALELATGERLVLTGVNESGLVVGVVVGTPDESPVDSDDAPAKTPAKKPRKRS